MSVIEIKVPVIGESITEVTLSQWLKENGSHVEIDEPICEFESDKATLELPAEKSGRLIWVAKAGDDLEIGALVAKIDTASGSAVVSAPEVPAVQVVAPVAAEAANASYAAGHPSPAAQKLLEENQLKASEVAGSGKDGRITKGDVVKAVDQKAAAPVAPAKPAAEKPAAPAAKTPAPPKPTAPASPVAFNREMRREKTSRMRRTIAKRLVEAKNETAMLTTFNEVDMSAIMELRKKYQDRFVKRYGIKLGFMSLFAKACAKTLIEMPDVNAIWDDDHLIYHQYADISIAVSTPTGLVVPVLKNVESLGFHQIETALAKLADKARKNELTLEEMTGGTFTITNGGIFGSMLSTPIINRPQSAILGMHNIVDRPVAINGEVKIRPIMYIALSYDHRVIDGSSAVTFLVKVKQLLEDPTALLLDL